MSDKGSAAVGLFTDVSEIANVDIGQHSPATGFCELRTLIGTSVADVDCGGGESGERLLQDGGERGGGRGESGWEVLGAGDPAAGPPVAAAGTPGDLLLQGVEGLGVGCGGEPGWEALCTTVSTASLLAARLDATSGLSLGGCWPLGWTPGASSWFW